MRILRVALAAFWLAVAAAPPTHALSMVPLYLEEIVDNAALAFEGTCIRNRTARDPATQLPVTYTTFAVRDVLKGSAPPTYEIKQLGGALPSEEVEYRVHGIPVFEEGRDYVVFLAGVSPHGFASPIGLSQGRFSIDADGAGRRVANGRDFKEMAARVLALVPERARARMQQAPGAVRDMDIEDFKQLVRARAGGAR